MYFHNQGFDTSVLHAAGYVEDRPGLQKIDAETAFETGIAMKATNGKRRLNNTLRRLGVFISLRLLSKGAWGTEERSR